MQGYKERLHWCIFNVIVRCFGIMAAIAGTGFISWGTYHFYHPAEAIKRAEYRGNAEQTFSHQTFNADLLGGVVTVEVAVGLFALALAVAVLRVRPYRPDLGDKVSSYAVGARSWWTGEPKTLDTNCDAYKDAPDQRPSGDLPTRRPG